MEQVLCISYNLFEYITTQIQPAVLNFFFVKNVSLNFLLKNVKIKKVSTFRFLIFLKTIIIGGNFHNQKFIKHLRKLVPVRVRGL